MLKRFQKLNELCCTRTIWWVLASIAIGQFHHTIVGWLHLNQKIATHLMHVIFDVFVSFGQFSLHQQLFRVVNKSSQIPNFEERALQVKVVVKNTLLVGDHHNLLVYFVLREPLVCADHVAKADQNYLTIELSKLCQLVLQLFHMITSRQSCEMAKHDHKQVFASIYLLVRIHLTYGPQRNGFMLIGLNAFEVRIRIDKVPRQLLVQFQRLNDCRCAQLLTI